MLGLYYRLWVDLIKRIRLQPANKNNWQAKSMIFMTIAMSFNLLLILTILERYIFEQEIYGLDIPFLSKRANNVVEFLVLFIFPFGIINHLLIFRKDRYVKLVKRYPYYQGKLFLTYFTLSLSIPILLLIIGLIIVN